MVLGARLAGAGPGDRAGLPAPRRSFGLASKIALDEFFFASEVVSAPVVPLREARRVVRELARSLDVFAARGWLDDPVSYHREPPPLEISGIDERRSALTPYRHLRYESGYQPHVGEPGRSRWMSYRGNWTAHAWLLRHPGPPRPWLVCIPGYRMGRPVVDFAGFRARWLHRQLGLNLAFPVLPLHGPRRIGRRDGDGFFTGDFVDTLHAQAQAVWEVRRLIGWLRSHGAPEVGTYGISLGGYTAALHACFDANLDCVIAGVPASDMERLLRSHTPAFAVRAAARAGFSFDDVGRMLRVVSPLALPPRVPHGRRFVYAGLVDRLAPPDHALALWNHWGRPRVVWYHGSHISFLWGPEVENLLRTALNETGFLPAYRPALPAPN